MSGLDEREKNTLDALVDGVDESTNNFDSTVAAIDERIDQVGLAGQCRVLGRLLVATKVLSDEDSIDDRCVGLLRHVIMDACARRSNLTTVLYGGLTLAARSKATAGGEDKDVFRVASDVVTMDALDRLGRVLTPTQRVAVASALMSAPSLADVASRWALRDVKNNAEIEDVMVAASPEVMLALWNSEEDVADIKAETLLARDGESLVLQLGRSERTRRTGEKFDAPNVPLEDDDDQPRLAPGEWIPGVLGDLGPWATVSTSRLRSVVGEESIEREADAAALLALLGRDESKFPVDVSINNRFVASFSGGGAKMASELESAEATTAPPPSNFDVAVLDDVLGHSIRQLSAERIAEALDAPTHRLTFPRRTLEAFRTLTGGLRFPAAVLRRAWCNADDAQMPLIEAVFLADDSVVEWTTEGDDSFDGVVHQTLALSRAGSAQRELAERALEGAVKTRGPERVVAALANVSEASQLRDKLLKRLASQLDAEGLSRLSPGIVAVALSDKIVVPFDARLSAPMVVDTQIAVQVLPMLLKECEEDFLVDPRLAIALVAAADDASRLRRVVAPMLARTDDASRHKAYCEATLEFVSRPRHDLLSPEVTQAALDVLLRCPKTNDGSSLDFDGRVDVAAAHFKEEYPGFFVEPRDPEDAAKAYLSRYAEETTTIDEILEVVGVWRASDTERGRRATSALADCLVVEPRLRLLSSDPSSATATIFNTDAKLAKAATLLGLSVSRLPRKNFDDALRLVVDCLRFPPGSPTFRFGKIALNELEPRLESLPHEFVRDLDSIPYLSAASSKVSEKVRALAAASSRNTTTTSMGKEPHPSSVKVSSSSSATPSFLRMLGQSITGSVSTLAGGRLLGGSPTVDDEAASIGGSTAALDQQSPADVDSGLESKAVEDEDAVNLTETAPVLPTGPLRGGLDDNEDEAVALGDAVVKSLSLGDSYGSADAAPYVPQQSDGAIAAAAAPSAIADSGLAAAAPAAANQATPSPQASSARLLLPMTVVGQQQQQRQAGLISSPVASGSLHQLGNLSPRPGQFVAPAPMSSGLPGSPLSLGATRHQPLLPSAENFAPQQQQLRQNSAPVSSPFTVGASTPTFTPGAGIQQQQSQGALNAASVPLHASQQQMISQGQQQIPSEPRPLPLNELMPASQDPLPSAPPSEVVLDCVHMVFNNVSHANLDAKVRDISPLLREEHFPWFANYLVVKRISTQPNFHSLFLAFLEKLGSAEDGETQQGAPGNSRRSSQLTRRTRLLHKAVVGAVYHNIAKLLRSNKITTSTSERSLLKNLGSWLGLITLARNRPILQRQLEVKELLFQGYETGRLIAICPFVAKILEGAKNSSVFRPPNPWLMGILGVLRELYNVEELKMNIKFEIEVLAKHLGVKIDQIEPSTLDGLSRRPTPVKERNPDFNVKRPVTSLGDDDGPGERQGSLGSQLSSQQHMSGLHLPVSQQHRAQSVPGFGSSGHATGAQGVSVPPRVGVPSFQPSQGLVGVPSQQQMESRVQQNVHQQQQPQQQPHQRTGDMGLLGGPANAQTAASRDPSSSASPGFAEQTVIPNLASYITVSAAGVSPTYAAALRRVAPVAVDRAIREIIQPVVERSVTIACITTKELVAKDFATEPDENRLRKAAQLMVSNLAGSLALVTCKEPLRVSIAKHLRSLLTQQPPISFNVDPNNETHAIQTCAAENLDLGCMLIEKAATEKAIRDVDESLAPAFKGRQKRREQGHAYVDVSPLGGDSQGRYPGALPEPLRPKATGLMPHQLYVYEAFARAPRHQQQQQSQGPPQPSAAAPGSNLGPAGAAGQSIGGSQGGMQQQTQGFASGGMPSLATQQQVAASNAQKEAMQRQQASQQRQRGRGGGAAALSAAARQAAAQQPDISIAELMEAYRSATAKLDLEFASLDQQLQQQGGGKQAAELVTFAQLRNHAIAAHVGELLLASSRVERGSRDDAALAIAQSTFKAMCEPRALEPPVRLETLAIILAATADISQGLSVREEVANWIGFLPARTEAERYLHSHVLARLLGVELLEIPDLDAYLAHNVDQGRSAPWLEIALGVVEIAVARYRLAVFPDHFPRLAAALDVVARSPNPPIALRRFIASLNADQQRINAQKYAQQQQQRAAQGRSDVPQQLVGQSPGGGPQQPPSGGFASAGQQRRPTQQQRDPAGAREQVTALLEQWIRVWNESPGSEKAYAQYLALLQQHGVPRVEASTDRFVRLAAMVCVDAARRRLQQQRQQQAAAGEGKGDDVGVIDYSVIDAYAKLLVLLVKYGGNSSSSSEGQSQNTRVALLNRVLSTLTAALIADYEADSEHRTFDQRPYFRLFLNLLQDLNVPDPVLDSSNTKLLAAFATTFHALQPSVVPAFAFSWLELVSHRMFMPNLLLAKGQKGWVLMHRLLIDLFVFLEPHLRNVQLSDAIRMLYRGTLRVLLVLLHDFPEFLSDYHFSFCDVIPASCIQLRNLFLSAFPRSMRLPDPFTPNLKVDLLPEISQPPRILSNCVVALNACGLREPLDEYLRTRHPIAFLLDLPRKLRRPGSADAYDAPLINGLVVHVGTTAIAQLNQKSSNTTSPIAHTTPMDIFQHLMNNLNSEGRYLLLNAIANQLRYPNNHTHYFSCVLLYLFAEATSEYIQEQVTRVLLERLIVHRPHPWGLLITFIELIKNPRYSFWSHSFTHCAQEIERVFESVARSCMGPGHMLNHQDGAGSETPPAAAAASA